jgi:hypothetical protein
VCAKVWSACTAAPHTLRSVSPRLSTAMSDSPSATPYGTPVGRCSGLLMVAIVLSMLVLSSGLKQPPHDRVRRVRNKEGHRPGVEGRCRNSRITLSEKGFNEQRGLRDWGPRCSSSYSTLLSQQEADSVRPPLPIQSQVGARAGSAQLDSDRAAPRERSWRLRNVYLVADTGAREGVAKLVDKAPTARRELLMSASVKPEAYPNVVPIFDQGEHVGSWVIVMQRGSTSLDTSAGRPRSTSHALKNVMLCPYKTRVRSAFPATRSERLNCHAAIPDPRPRLSWLSGDSALC